MSSQKASLSQQKNIGNIMHLSPKSKRCERTRDGFKLPEELLTFPPLKSLWLAVAHWAHIQARPVSRDDIAIAFYISQRRAADVMTYIVNQCSEVVSLTKNVTRRGAGRRVATISVTAICEKKQNSSTINVKQSKRLAANPVKNETNIKEMQLAKKLALGIRTLQ